MEMKLVLSVLVLSIANLSILNGLEVSGSCDERCGARYNKSESCQCNTKCSKYNNCCLDYSTLCDAVLSSCEGRCGDRYSKSFSCQCNTKCAQFKDCCQDYSTVCDAGTSRGCKDFGQLTRDLWDSDTDRLSPDDVTLNYQAQLPDKGNIEDKSREKLFSYVNEEKLSSPMFKTFLALLDNYDPQKGDPEVVTPEEKAEEKAFLDAILSSATFRTLYDYLLCEGKVQNEADLRGLLQRLWFDLYPRSGNSSVPDTSGFEHVMVGEFKSSGSASGLHNWLAFYMKEKKAGEPNINYYGHTCDVDPHIACAAFDWDGRKKRLASFFLNTSPAYELAVYSVCYIMYPDSCRVVLGDGTEKVIQTYSKDGHIATAFVEV